MIVTTTTVPYPFSCVALIFNDGQSSHDGDRKNFKVIMSTSTLALEIFALISYILAATIYHVKEVQTLKYRMN